MTNLLYCFFTAGNEALTPAYFTSTGKQES